MVQGYSIKLTFSGIGKKPKKKGDWAELLLVVIPKNILVIIAVTLIALGLNKNILFAIGWVIFILGISIRFIALKQLGSMYSLNVEIRENHKLIDFGIFSIVRHPLYLAYIIDTLGIILFLQKMVFIPVLVLATIGVLIRIKNEERELEKVFDQKYIEYKNKVPAIIPFLKLFKGKLK